MRRPLKIKPSFDFPEGFSKGFEFYAQGIEDSLQKLISKKIKLAENESDEILIKELINNLPLIDWESSKTSGIISLTCLAPATNTHGLGRFICDHSSRWLLPGKQLPLVHVNSLAFSLEKDPKATFFFHQQLIRVDQIQELNLILSNLELFTKQLKMNILTVMHARNVVMLKTLTLDEKKMIIEENIATLLGKSQKEIDHSAYDHTHRFILKIISEEKVEQFKESLNSLVNLRPQIFDRDLFNELQDRISMLSDEFIACRDHKHLTRMISYEYLFRKNMLHVVAKYPSQRHLSFKLFQTQLKNFSTNQSILAVIVSMNLLRENEIFQEKHLFKALQACQANIIKVKNSFIENRPDKNLRSFYIEVEKKDHKPFDLNEIGNIKKKFSQEIKTRIESVYSPVFMPKNEEEVLKTILILSNELKYITDIPQVYISFQKQTESKIWFNVILLRLVKPTASPTRSILNHLNSNIKIENIDIKIVGNLRKKYPKEAAICDVYLDKKLFLRKDFSLDLFEARRMLIRSLEETFGEIRDYNGGIILKQNEALSQLRELLQQSNIQNDFLVENYFYSLSPSYMPSILPSIVLKKHFNLVLKAFDKTYTFKDVFFEIQYFEQYLVVLVASSNNTFRDFILSQIDKQTINSTHMAILKMQALELYLVGYILKTDQKEEEHSLVTQITQSIQKWNATLERDEFNLTEMLPTVEPALVFN